MGWGGMLGAVCETGRHKGPRGVRGIEKRLSECLGHRCGRLVLPEQIVVLISLPVHLELTSQALGSNDFPDVLS